MPNRIVARAALLLSSLVLAAGAASAQGVTVQSISSPAPALGQVVSGASGPTIFEVSASNNGLITKRSGTGYRLGSSGSRPLVTLACGSDAECATDDIAVTISSISTPSGRAGALGNFTVEGLTAQVKTGPSGTDPVTFTIEPIGTNSTRTFYIGADFPILGDDSNKDTGAATSSFQVSAKFSPSGTPDMAMGMATATVFRPLTLSGTHNLVFGTITKPRTGDGTVTIDPTGHVEFTGDGVRGIGTAPQAATYSVTGEGGQAFSLLVPEDFSMNGTGGSILVTLTPSVGTSLALDGSIGSSASMDFAIGGSFALHSDTEIGAYSGTFIVTVQYQ